MGQSNVIDRSVRHRVAFKMLVVSNGLRKKLDSCAGYLLASINDMDGNGLQIQTEEGVV